jgi:hypothetical protein
MSASEGKAAIEGRRRQHQCDELARRIIATPAHTREALNGKLHVVELADYNDGDSLIIETILELDDARVRRAAGETEADEA